MDEPLQATELTSFEEFLSEEAKVVYRNKIDAEVADISDSKARYLQVTCEHDESNEESETNSSALKLATMFNKVSQYFVGRIAPACELKLTLFPGQKKLRKILFCWFMLKEEQYELTKEELNKIIKDGVV
jgi:hypothetical protein